MNDSGRAAEVREAVERILRSAGFQNSTRRGQLLKYVVDRTLAGEGEAISEYGIGVDVFGKPSSFDPRLESIVRTEFSRLRHKLADYYAAEGREDAVVVEFPSRTYAPEFRFDAAPRRPSAPPRHSYRWIAVAGSAGLIIAVAAGAWLLRVAPAHPTALVVLPFKNLSPDRTEDYLADGITEELTNQLAQSKELRVIARTSASVFEGKAVDVREIGRKLGVGFVVEGSVAPENGRVRITAQLNRTTDGTHVWSRAYEASSSDLLEVEQDIAGFIASATGLTRVRTEGAGGTRDPEAHDLYLRAYHLASGARPDYASSLAVFRQAITRDPGYVNAYIGIARVEIAMVHMTEEPPETAIPNARMALETALSHDPGSGEARGVLADVIAIYDWDWPRAEREFRQALEDGAQSTTRSLYGSLLATRGRFGEAEAQLRLAEDADPLGMGPRFNEFMAFFLQRDYAAARRVLTGMTEMNADQFDARFMLGGLDLVEHDCAGSRREYEWAAHRLAAPVTDIGLALAAACSHDRAQALVHLRQSEKASPAGYTSPYQMAVGYAAIGDAETALTWLERSAARKEMQVLYLNYDPFFDSIRSDPRYSALERRVRLIK